MRDELIIGKQRIGIGLSANLGSGELTSQIRNKFITETVRSCIVGSDQIVQKQLGGWGQAP